MKSMVVFEFLNGNIHLIAEQVAADLDTESLSAVDDTTGPLLDGEAERARRWGEELAGRLHTSAAGARSR